MRDPEQRPRTVASSVLNPPDQPEQAVAPIALDKSGRDGDIEDAAVRGVTHGHKWVDGDPVEISARADIACSNNTLGYFPYPFGQRGMGSRSGLGGVGSSRPPATPPKK